MIGLLKQGDSSKEKKNRKSKVASCASFDKFCGKRSVSFVSTQGNASCQRFYIKTNKTKRETLGSSKKT